jgi:hypothetical protein
MPQAEELLVVGGGMLGMLPACGILPGETAGGGRGR